MEQLVANVADSEEPSNSPCFVALGASNLTRGFRVVTSLARATWGDPLQIVAALGHGRSYGMKSHLLGRTLPGILESGLWEHLAGMTPLRALVTDVGNDLLYGADVPRILAWVDECVRRLAALGAEVVMTDLPIASIERLSSARFLAFRSILVPSCRLSLSEITARALDLQRGLVDLAGRRGAVLGRLRPEWYGLDPIHIRPRLWGEAWQAIFLAGHEQRPDIDPRRAGPMEWLRYYRLKPERWWRFGIERRQPQPVLRFAGGSAIHLF